MKKSISFLLILHLSVLTIIAQNKAGIVRGKLTDTIFRESMSEATISLLTLTDSSVIAFSLANSKGDFEIRGVDNGSYRLIITFQGYQTVSSVIQISASKRVLDLGNIHLEKKKYTS